MTWRIFSCTRTERNVRPMTEAEAAAMDAAFKGMGEAFAAMDRAFDELRKVKP